MFKTLWDPESNNKQESDGDDTDENIKDEDEDNKDEEDQELYLAHHWQDASIKGHVKV